MGGGGVVFPLFECNPQFIYILYITEDYSAEHLLLFVFVSLC